MSNVNAIRILIADDHPVVRQGLAAMIDNESDMTVVAQAENGQEAVNLYALHSPDVALLDLRMPGLHGVQAITAIREGKPTAQIIVLTTFDHEDDVYRALRAGAHAYLLKDVPPDELLTTIRAVHAGQKYIPAKIGAKLSEHFATQELTRRELDVLKLVAGGSRNGQIGNSLSISEGTVKYHVNNILSKLGASDRTQAVALALQRGIVQI